MNPKAAALLTYLSVATVSLAIASVAWWWVALVVLTVYVTWALID